MANDNGKKRTNAATWQWAADGSEATVTWADGVQRGFTVAQFAPEIIAAAVRNGLEQKLRDTYAIAAREVDGSVVYPTVEEKRAAFDATLEHMLAGSWNMPRGEGEPRGLVFQALAALYPKVTRAEWDARIAAGAKSKGVSEAAILRSIRARADVAAKIEEIRAASGVKTVNVDDILGEAEQI